MTPAQVGGDNLVDPRTLRGFPAFGPPGDRVVRISPSLGIAGFFPPKNIRNPPNWRTKNTLRARFISKITGHF